MGVFEINDLACTQDTMKMAGTSREIVHISSILNRMRYKVFTVKLSDSVFLVFIFLCLFVGAKSQVTQEWTVRFNGPGNDGDYAEDITVDGVGNVYVTGRSDGGASYYDFRTLKYDTNGNELWNVRYTGPAGSRDEAHAVTVDENGYVYVTGESQETGFADYVTIKYSPNGSQIWANRYNGPSNHIDVARAIELDSTGSIYITGTSGPDIGTIKYSSDGVELWVQRYDGPDNLQDQGVDLTIAPGGNVIVTGSSYSSYRQDDFVTICYSSDGDQLWVQRYEGSSVDEISQITTDIFGNIFVVGGTVNNTTFDYLIIAYSAIGDELWIRSYDGSNDDNVKDVVTDSDGNIFVTGESEDATGFRYDYVTLKYNPAGQQVWVQRYDGPENQEDRAVAIAIDYTDGIIVSGHSLVTQSDNDDYVTIKYDTDGLLLWSIGYNGPEESFDITTAMDVDIRGNVYVTGYSWGGSSSQDYATVKYHQPSPEIESATDSVFFGEVVVGSSAQENLSISNVGDTTLIISSVTIDNSAFSHEVSISSVDSGQNLSFPIVFSPDSSLNEVGLLEIQSNDPALPLLNIKLLGLGISAADVYDYSLDVPGAYMLRQNYPNPFNPITTLRYDLPERSEVVISIYDILGRKIRTLVQGVEEPGYKSVTWDGTNDLGEGVSVGIYIYQIQAGDFTQIRKMLLLK